MPDKQLENTKKAAEAAEDEPAANDHYDKILEQLQHDSEDRMGKAVSVAQEALSKMTVRGDAVFDVPANFFACICAFSTSLCVCCLFAVEGGITLMCTMRRLHIDHCFTSSGPSHDEHESDERELKKTAEEGKVAVRNVRRQVMQKIGRLARDGTISQDDQDRMTDFIQHLTDQRVDAIEELIKSKRTKI